MHCNPSLTSQTTAWDRYVGLGKNTWKSAVLETDQDQELQDYKQKNALQAQFFIRRYQQSRGDNVGCRRAKIPEPNTSFNYDDRLCFALLMKECKIKSRSTLL